MEEGKKERCNKWTRNLYGHGHGHGPHSWNHQDARKLQRLLRDPRICAMFSPKAFLLPRADTVWGLRRLSQERVPLPSSIRNAQNCCQRLPYWQSSSQDWAERRWGRAGMLSGVLPGFQTHGAVEPATDRLHLSALPASFFTFLRSQKTNCNVLSLSLCHSIFTSLLYGKKGNKRSLGYWNQASRCFQRKVSVRRLIVWLNKTHYLTKLHSDVASPTF